MEGDRWSITPASKATILPASTQALDSWAGDDVLDACKEAPMSPLCTMRLCGCMLLSEASLWWNKALANHNKCSVLSLAQSRVRKDIKRNLCNSRADGTRSLHGPSMTGGHQGWVDSFLAEVPTPAGGQHLSH